LKPRKAFPLRLDPEVYRVLEAWARQELRSVNGQIEWILKESLARHFRREFDPPAATSDGAEPDPSSMPETPPPATTEDGSP
jgi:hypothetical protein